MDVREQMHRAGVCRELAATFRAAAWAFDELARVRTLARRALCRRELDPETGQDLGSIAGDLPGGTPEERR